MNFVQPPSDASDQQAAVAEAMNQLLAVMQPQVQNVEADWDGFSVPFAFNKHDGQTVLARVDAFFYAIVSGTFSVSFDPEPLRQAAIDFIDASAGQAGFQDSVVAVFTYRRDTRQMGAECFFDDDANAVTVNGSNADDVAAKLDPFTAQG